MCPPSCKNKSMLLVQLYKHHCVSVCLSVCLCVCPNFPKSVNETSTEARLAPGSCKVDYKQLNLSSLGVQSYSAWPKPIFLSLTTSATPVRES